MLGTRTTFALLAGVCLCMAAFASSAQERKELIPPTRSASAATGSATKDFGKSPGDVALPVEDPDATKTTKKPLPPAEKLLESEKTIIAPAANHNSFSRYDALLTALTVFALAVFVGFEVISKVPTTLHTPLMSGSNAISGITVVGAIIVGGYSQDAFSSFLGFLAIVLAMNNVVGGFLVTHRMLAMFKRK